MNLKLNLYNNCTVSEYCDFVDNKDQRCNIYFKHLDFKSIFKIVFEYKIQLGHEIHITGEQLYMFTIINS